MTKLEKKQLRADLFRHLDGIVTAPTAYVLHEQGILDVILKEGKTTLKALTAAFKANEGYLNVALHTLASQGWLKHEIVDENDIHISTNAKSATAFQLIPLYQEVVELMHLSGKYHHRKFEVEPFRLLERIFKNYKDNYGIEWSENAEERVIQEQVLKHIEGMIVGPTVVALGMNGMFHKYFMEASFMPEEFHADGESFGRLLDMFVYLDWFQKKKDTYRFTEKGLFYARRASAYGVTVSYIPMFRK